MREYDDDLASWPIRVAAHIIDSIIPAAGLALIAIAVAVAFGVDPGDAAALEESHDPQTPVWLVPVVLAGAAVFIGYFVWWLISLKDGQTPGKKIVGIRVVNARNGETLGWGMMFVREFLVKNLLFSIFGGMSLGIAQILNFLWPLWDANSQALHDKIVNTQVIYN